MKITTFIARVPVALALLALCAAAPLWAQARGAGQGGGPRYDTATEATVIGTVDSVEQMAGPGGGRGRLGLGGTHLVLKAEAGTLQVHLGPTAFLSEKGITLAKGDEVQIVGSRVKVDDEDVFIAKSVRKGEQTWMLRDESGRPLWRGGRRGGQ
jgi:hypothetical protein